MRALGGLFTVIIFPAILAGSVCLADETEDAIRHLSQFHEYGVESRLLLELDPHFARDVLAVPRSKLGGGEQFIKWTGENRQMRELLHTRWHSRVQEQDVAKELALELRKRPLNLRFVDATIISLQKLHGNRLKSGVESFTPVEGDVYRQNGVYEFSFLDSPEVLDALLAAFKEILSDRNHYKWKRGELKVQDSVGSWRLCQIMQFLIEREIYDSEFVELAASWVQKGSFSFFQRATERESYSFSSDTFSGTYTFRALAAAYLGRSQTTSVKAQRKLSKVLFEKTSVWDSKYYFADDSREHQVKANALKALAALRPTDRRVLRRLKKLLKNEQAANYALSAAPRILQIAGGRECQLLLDAPKKK